MKSMNINVVLIVIIGIASGLLLHPDSMFSLPVQSDPEADDATLVQVRENAFDAEGRVDSESVLAITKAGRKDSYAISAATEAESREFAFSADAEPVDGRETSFRVVGLTAKPSKVYVAVFESDAGFPKSELSTSTKIVTVTENQVVFLLELPRDQAVAIAVFQDLDGNGTLTKNALGIPTEPYGFSNNVRGVFGPPSFKQAAFSIMNRRESADPVEIRVR